jgi:2-succinyl-5-enolpyruvyl-6-hydroxy-3-cyclohexene-1-carboxylate synthase
MTSPRTVQARFATTIVDEWVRCGVTHAFVAPGSRSTPLAVALAANPGVAVQVVLDERSAAFRGLGFGLASGRPAVVLTTSGTAAVELHPAVVEAHQARVPLLAVTADRPPELHHVGAPQTVEQVGLFGDAVRWAHDPGPADAAVAGAWRSLAARAVVEAIGSRLGPGPVHLNLPFREPLVGEAGEIAPEPEPGRAGGGPWHRPEAAPPLPPAELVEGLARPPRRGVVLAGGGAGEASAIHAAAAALGWPVLADPRSGARVPGPGTVAAADALLRSSAFVGANRPEVILRLGGTWASRVVAEWAAGLDVEQVLVDPWGGWSDPDRTASVVAACDPTMLCLAVAEAAAGRRRAPRAWLHGWRVAEAAAQRAIDRVLEGHRRPTEPGVARDLVAVLPDGAALVTSSSMPVRDVEWYAAPRDGVRVLANRGANGIDGVTSTALGVATAARRPVAALVGDLAFLHDQGALVGAATSRVSCTLVVVDNDGGGIFSFLPQALALPAERFEQLFGTPHGVDLAAVARAHGIAVAQPDTAAAVRDAIADAVTAGGVRMIHVRTERAANVAVHDEIHRAVAQAVA